MAEPTDEQMIAWCDDGIRWVEARAKINRHYGASDDLISMYEREATMLRSIAARLRAGAPAGYVVAPRDMLDNAAHRLAMSDFSADQECGAELAAMLAAAPSAPPAVSLSVGKSEPPSSKD